MLCGKPCVGKTHFAHTLREFLAKEHEIDAIVVNIESLGLKRDQAYAGMCTLRYDAVQQLTHFLADPCAEKATRGALMSETYRQLGAGKTVILDALNLISGYRYQIWCQAREAGTGYALVSKYP